jgi:hypothetical protein
MLKNKTTKDTQIKVYKVIGALRSQDSTVSIVTGYGLDNRGVGVRVPVGSRIPSFPRPYWLWGPPNLLFNGYWGLFPQEKSSRSVKLTTHLELVAR